MGLLQLPIPINYNGKIYKEITIRKMNGGVLADTNEAREKGNTYTALKTFISGCIESIGDIVDLPTIKNITGYIAYDNVNYIITKILSIDDDDASIEGIYSCPLCGNKIICQHDKISEKDTSDKIKNLKVAFLKSDKLFFTYKLKEVITIEEKEVNGTVEEIQSMFTTLNQCEKASNEYGEENKSQLQYAILSKGIMKIDGVDVTEDFKEQCGINLFRKMDFKDLNNFSEKTIEYGLQNEVDKKCNKCGKVFKVVLNTSNFFVSALR